jgi:hypothetical protein
VRDHSGSSVIGDVGKVAPGVGSGVAPGVGSGVAPGVGSGVAPGGSTVISMLSDAL